MAKTAAPSDPALYCRKCSYDLRGQVEHRCPECGRPYDPADAKTFRRRPRGRAGTWIKRIAVVLVVLLLLATAPYAWLYCDWRREQPAVERMRELNAYVEYKSIDPPVLARLLPKRFVWMLKRVSYMQPRSGQVTDPEIALLARCRGLDTLWLPRSAVTDRGVEAISQLRDLRRLRLSGSGITDASAAHLGQCRQLSWLFIGETSLTDEGLARLCALPELTMLCVESPRLTDAGLLALADLPKLDDLRISAPALDDDGLAILSRLSRLQCLWIRSDGCTTAGEKRLRQSLPRCRIYVERYSPGGSFALPPR